MTNEKINFNELVTVENNQPVTTSKNVANVFNKSHNHVLRDIEDIINKIGKPNLDSQMFYKTTYENRGKQYPMYVMTRDGFTLLVMGYNGKKAIEFKLDYINAFNTMEKKLKEQQNQVAIPSYQIDDPVKRAERWIEEEKERQKLALENKTQKQQINEMQPKVSYYDEILANKELLPISVIAKDYGMSAKKMNNLLHELKVQYKQGRVWLLYTKYQTEGYTKTFTENNKRTQYTFTKWTQKGRLFLYELLKQNGYLPLIEQNNVE